MKLTDRWSLPGWARVLLGGVAFLLLVISLVTTPQAVRDLTQDYPFLRNPTPWGVILALAIVLGYVALRSGAVSSPSRPRLPAQARRPKTQAEADAIEAALVKVERKKFGPHATVILDGHWYIECEFHRCRFQYDGGHFKTTGVILVGGQTVATSNATVRGTIELMRELHMLHEDVRTGPDGGPVSPP